MKLRTSLSHPTWKVKTAEKHQQQIPYFTFIGQFLLPTQTSLKARSQKCFEIVVMIFAQLKTLAFSFVDTIWASSKFFLSGSRNTSWTYLLWKLSNMRTYLFDSGGGILSLDQWFEYTTQSTDTPHPTPPPPQPCLLSFLRSIWRVSTASLRSHEHWTYAII